MKITCQSCQSKYTIADEKIQGKVAKIRCRKCGATVLVDGSASGASNGPGASAGDSWLANVADGDQRTLQLSELVEAYQQGIVTGDTYIWKDGMPDWLPLSQVAEVMGALSNPGGGAVPYDAPAPVAPAPVAAAPVAARRDAARGRGATNLFGAGREEEVATSAAPPARLAALEPRAATPGLSSGARDEQSVLFSLSALTGAAARSGGSSGGSSSFSSGSSSMGSTSGNSEDSGLIDLNALAKAQAAVAREGAVAAPAPTPFMFPAALGTIEPAAIALEEPKKPKTMLFVAIGGVVAAAAVAAAIFATRKPEVVETASSAALAASAAPVASAPVAPAEPEAAASAAPAASAAKTAATPRKGPARPAGAAKPTAVAGPAAAAPALPPAPKKTGGCGCAPGDLQCQIRCSATGH